MLVHVHVLVQLTQPRLHTQLVTGTHTQLSQGSQGHATTGTHTALRQSSQGQTSTGTHTLLRQSSQGHTTGTHTALRQSSQDTQQVLIHY